VKTLADRFATPDPACCMVCRRRALPYGTIKKGDRSRDLQIYWLCDDPKCIQLGQKVLTMPAKKLDAYERKARQIASDEAGEYLDQLGKTDLAKLSETEWITFNEKIIFGFERAMRDVISSGEAPF
jgi:hypothetical protein